MNFNNKAIFGILLIICLISCKNKEVLYLPDLASPLSTEIGNNIKMSPNKSLISIEVSSSFFSTVTNSTFGVFSNEDSLKKLTQMVENRFKEDFDFIFFINNSKRSINQAYGASIKISNNVSGIGLRNFENDLKFSNSKKIQSIIMLTDSVGLSNGPALHEISHNWANYIGKGLFKTMDSNNSDYRELDADPHWGFTSIGGQLGGFKLNSLKLLSDLPKLYHAEGLPSKKPTFGLTANEGNSLPYAPLELYLMGFGLESDVPDITYFSDLTISKDFFTNGNFYSKTIKNISLNDLIIKNNLGVRKPDYYSSQKNFRGIVVVITEKPLTSSKWKFFESEVSNFFGKVNVNRFGFWSFYDATNNKAFIKVDELDLELD